MTHVSSALGNKYGCETHSRKLGHEEVIARYSEIVALEVYTAATNERGEGAGNTRADIWDI